MEKLVYDFFTMSGWNWNLSLILMLSVLVGLLSAFYLKWRNKEWRVSKCLGIAGGIVVVVLFFNMILIGILSYACLTDWYTNFVIASPDGEVLMVSKNRSRLFPKHDPILKNPILPIDKIFVETEMSLHGDFDYSVTLVFDDKPEVIAKNCGPHGSVEMFQYVVEHTLRAWLYEFNREYSDRFPREFYNPENFAQEERFSELLESYLGPLVQKEWQGGHVGSTYFHEKTSEQLRRLLEKETD